MRVEELTTAEIAARFGVTVRTVQRWIREKKLAVTPVQGKRYAINLLDFDRKQVMKETIPYNVEDWEPKSEITSQPSIEQVLFERIVDLQMEVNTLSTRLAEAEKRFNENRTEVEMQEDYSHFPGDLTPILRLTESIGITPAVLAMSILEWDDTHNNAERRYWKQKKPTGD